MLVMRKVILGFVGTQLDSARGPERWQRWRPTVALGQHDDLRIDRMELFYTARPDRYIDQLLTQVRADLASVSPSTEVNVHQLAIVDPWDFGEVYAALYDFVGSYRFKPDEEEYWVHITTGTHVAQICLFLLTESRFVPGVLLQTSPPRKNKAGDAGSYALIDLDLSKYDQIAMRSAAEEANAISFLKSGIATRNARFNALIEEVERVAVRSKAPMLLTGPTGAGKSFLARRVFELKRARQQLTGAFIEVNCATLKGDGAGSTLFGHVRGAFTGAASDRAGLLKSAHKGLLFLDEIGELGLDEQAMLLKAIEEKRFLPVGSDREVESHFQLIAGTNRDLRQDVSIGRFREDLFARINLWTYALPGLTERREDIEPNLEFTLAQWARENGQMARFNKEARQRYLRFAESPAARWQGNFRDLSASVMRMATLAESGRITERVVDEEIGRLQAAWATPETAAANNAAAPAAAMTDLLDASELDALDLFDRQQLAFVVQVCRESRTLSEAGRRLFNVSRTERQSTNDADRLRKYLSKFGLTWQAIAARADA
jgi:transcriptional regulatory protein RtcR